MIAQPPLFAPYFTNRLYENNFFCSQLPSMILDTQEKRDLFEAVKALHSGKNLSAMNEAQLEDAIIKPMLVLLGWAPLYQEVKIFQGGEEKPDWTLFASEAEKAAYLAYDKDARRDRLAGIVSFCESKASDKNLDTGKAKKDDNPYRQILHYLTYARKDFGFLTNGLEWWLVDNRAVSSQKRYLRVALAEILDKDAYDEFRIFAHLFARSTYVPDVTEKKTGFDKIAEAEATARLAVEEDLRSVIYGADGRDSLFERIGTALFAATGNEASPENLRHIFENSLYLVFRFLFIAYFEDRYGEQLQRHPYYAFSLHKLHEKLERKRDIYTGWNDLQNLFKTLNDGNANLGIPLLNGGLFDNRKAVLLSMSRVMDNYILAKILDDLFLFCKKEDQHNLLQRDFRSLSVTHLGTIYEGLLEFEFRVAQENLSYITYSIQEKNGKKTFEGFFDSYDAAQLVKLKANILNERPLAEGSFYLVNKQNSRKASGSYYTPSSLSLPLVRRAIDYHLPKVGSVLDLRILDNACGSGHILVEALNYLTRRALEHLDTDAALTVGLETEKERIAKTQDELAALSNAPPLAVDEADIVKRLLLKTVIYGVDLQPFAVELAHLSLWIDSFVFGTPLSFIEHHVKSGNSLIGATQNDFDAFLTEGGSFGLFTIDLNKQFKQLNAVCVQLNSIQDTTREDIERSKDLYYSKITPILNEMNLYLDLVNTRNMMIHEGKKKESQALTLGDTIHELVAGRNNALLVRIGQYQNRYGFFNWEVEFPEAFGGKEQGFHIIIGNPPWDKTEFTDPDFFAQYRSDYRSLSNSQKKQLQDDLMVKPYVREAYEEQKQQRATLNEYYKKHAAACSGGKGDTARFFVDRNLRLLAPGGTLNYVLPTGLLTEDGSANLRKEIFRNYSVIAFDGFENRQKIFPDVDSRYKFGLLQIVKRKDLRQQAKTRFMLVDPDVLHSDAGVFAYGLEDVQATSPDYMAYMEVRHGRDDLDVLTKVYSAFQPLGVAWLKFRVEMNSTLDKKVFLESKGGDSLPLYKGDMIWQYDSLFGLPEYWLAPDTFDAHLKEREISRLIDDVFPQLAAPPKEGKQEAVLRSLGLTQREELAAFVRPDRNYYRLSFRDIARDTDERTLIASVVPPHLGAQDTLWMSVPKRYRFDTAGKTIGIEETPLPRLFFAQALFNSLAMDWILRFSAAIHVTKSLLTRLPLPQPADTELRDNPVYAGLCRNSLLLSLYHNPAGFQSLQDMFGLTGKDIPTTPKQADMLRIQNDHLVARLYGLSKTEFEHMLQSFVVLGKKRPEYVTAAVKGYIENVAQ